MQSYEQLIYEIIKGSTPKEKYDNLKGLLSGVEVICYPRRGTDEWFMQDISEAAKLLFPYINKPE